MQEYIALKPRTLYILILLLVAIGIGISLLRQTQRTISLNQFAHLLNSGQVAAITVHQQRITLDLPNGSRLYTFKDDHSTIYETLAHLHIGQEQLQDVILEVKSSSLNRLWRDFLVFGLPLIIIIAMVVNVIHHSRLQNGKTSERAHLGKSTARLTSGEVESAYTFDDVAGLGEAKEELQEIIVFLKDPERFLRIGARAPRGVLMVGPPGTGKTLMARAIAGEAGVPFFNSSGSEFVEMYAGVGASRVRDLFEQAIRLSPAIIFIDEIDAIGRTRGMGSGQSSDEREQTLNQILAEIDGFDGNQGVIVIAATNRPEILDPALLRPGRFDRQVHVGLPDLAARTQILSYYLNGKPLANDVAVDVLAKQTTGFVGADLENLVNEAAVLAVRNDRSQITLADFEEGIERVTVGTSRRPRTLTDEEKKLIAYHEAGHAIAMYYQTFSDPVHKITILGRGQSLGYTISLPEEERIVHDQAKYEAELIALLSGRTAEILIFGKTSTAGNKDISQATRLAYWMIGQCGMGQSIGPMSLPKGGQNNIPLSQAFAQRVDEEAYQLLKQSEEKSLDLLRKYRHDLDRVAEALIQKETLSRQEFENLMAMPTSK